MKRGSARTRSRWAVAAVVLSVLAAGLPAGAAVAGSSATDLLPNLRMLRPAELHLCAAPLAQDACPAPDAGTRYLRFSATMTNVGRGPFQVRGTRICADCDHMTTRQFIRQDTTPVTFRVLPTAALQQYVTADHHHHWHTMGMESYQLLGLDAPIAGDTPVGHKYGFCFFDGIPWKLGLRDARARPHFSYFGCGFPTSQTTLVGLSVGWADIYPWDFAGQYIDITGVTDGEYLLCMTADPANDFVESSDTDNQSWAHVTLSGTATPTPTMIVGATGQQPCQSQLSYPLPAHVDLPDGAPLVVATQRPEVAR